MATPKLGPKVGQIDIHKKPKKGFFEAVGEVVGGIVLVIVVIAVIRGLVG